MYLWSDRDGSSNKCPFYTISQVGNDLFSANVDKGRFITNIGNLYNIRKNILGGTSPRQRCRRSNHIQLGCDDLGLDFAVRVHRIPELEGSLLVIGHICTVKKYLIPASILTSLTTTRFLKQKLWNFNSFLGKHTGSGISWGWICYDLSLHSPYPATFPLITQGSWTFM